MAEETRVQAEAALKDVEAITAHLLPEPKGEVVPADAADPATRAEIEQAQGRDRPLEHPVDHPLRLAAQAELQAISQEMLSGVRSKDVGPAGN